MEDAEVVVGVVVVEVDAEGVAVAVARGWGHKSALGSFSYTQTPDQLCYIHLHQNPATTK